jgi:GNAT superfamily N-acetyltransferase
MRNAPVTGRFPLFRRLFAALDWRGMHLVRIVHRSLATPIPFEPSEGTVIRPLSREEALACAGDAELEMPEAWIREACTLNGGCMAAFVGNELAGYVWFAYERAPDVDGIWVRVPAGAVYRFKAFVRPRFRGRRVAPLLSGGVDGIAIRDGCRSSIAFIAVHNTASLNASKAIGSTTLGHVAYWKCKRLLLALYSPAVRRAGLRFYLP